MKKKRLMVGFTGSYGSGKSTVGRIFKQLGASKVMDADQIAHEVFRNTHPLRKRVKHLFHISGALNRKKVADWVFSDPSKRKKLEAIVHPYVFRRIRSELSKVRSGIVIVEVPLLFETGFNQFCDVTIVVLSKEQDIITRLKRAGHSSGDIRARLRAQISDREKKKHADLFIRNTGSKRQLQQQTKSIWGKLKGFLNETI